MTLRKAERPLALEEQRANILKALSEFESIAHEIDEKLQADVSELVRVNKVGKVRSERGLGGIFARAEPPVEVTAGLLGYALLPALSPALFIQRGRSR